MDKDFALNKWVPALRSGQYRQTTGILREGNTFCCLGVACDISGLGRWSAAFRYVVGGEQRSGGLPIAVREYLQITLDSDLGIIPVLRDRNEDKVILAELNDNGFTFNQIADVIECFWEDL